jgi:hypothetical protein
MIVEEPVGRLGGRRLLRLLAGKLADVSANFDLCRTGEVQEHHKGCVMANARSSEHWQSEFLQLLWQAFGLARFYFWGSSQSKQGDVRLEHKIDLLLRDRGIDPAKLRPVAADDDRYPANDPGVPC